MGTRHRGRGGVPGRPSPLHFEQHGRSKRLDAGEFLKLVIARSCAIAGCPFRDPSEPQLSSQLNHTRSRITSDTRTHNAGGWLFQIEDLSECRVGTGSIRKAKIGMVEQIKKLESESQLGIFPTMDFSILHDGKIGIEVARPPKAVSALRERYRRTIAHT